MVGNACANIRMLEMVLHQTRKNEVFYICWLKQKITVK